MHETDVVALMHRISHHLQTFHKCTREFSDWKVTEMTVAELQFMETKCNANIASK